MHLTERDGRNLRKSIIDHGVDMKLYPTRVMTLLAGE